MLTRIDILDMLTRKNSCSTPYESRQQLREHNRFLNCDQYPSTSGKIVRFRVPIASEDVIVRKAELRGGYTIHEPGFNKDNNIIRLTRLLTTIQDLSASCEDLSHFGNRQREGDLVF